MFLVTLTVLLSVLIFTVAANGADTGDNCETVAARGEILSGILRRYTGNTDIRQYIERIKEVNGMEDSTIYEGDIIKLPL